ncbi:MAG: precorrin-2 dehydrogenase/sirohydrochlorin ferrochelatase family protein [Nitrospiraceae bacterium]
MPANPGFPLSLDVKGWPCLVLGGDDEASEKTLRLLDAGAKVIVISPTLNEALRKLTASAKVIHRGRRFRETDLESVILVMNTLRDDPDFSKSLLTLARQKRFLLWSVDQPEWSNVFMPAVVSRGHLRIAVSTSGTAPALASRLRQDLEQIFGEDCAAFLDWLADLRDETKAAQQDAEKRRALLWEVVADFKLNGSIEYPKAWLEGYRGSKKT